MAADELSATRPPVVRRGTALAFPRDHGAHTDYRIEWWYVTGWLSPTDRPIGFQMTFFRLRTDYSKANPSRFAPTQLLLAHAAVSDPTLGRLRVAQQAWRVGPGVTLGETDTDLRARDWFMRRLASGRYEARASGPDFRIALTLMPAQPPVLQGEQGYSRKGPGDNQASYYYSRPQMRVDASLQIGAEQRQTSGLAWLDHEWSSRLLPAGAIGWDWLGINFADGATLIAFRLRTRDGSSLYAHARLREAHGSTTDAIPTFEPLRHWRSTRTDVRYPVQWRLRFGERDWQIDPLFDDQELDASRSTGIVYWEGAVRASTRDGPPGLGYLELTGYGAPMRIGSAG